MEPTCVPAPAAVPRACRRTLALILARVSLMFEKSQRAAPVLNIEKYRRGMAGYFRRQWGGGTVSAVPSAVPVHATAVLITWAAWVARRIGFCMIFPAWSRATCPYFGHSSWTWFESQILSLVPVDVRAVALGLHGFALLSLSSILESLLKVI